jgi:hypothetical protein
MDEPCSALVFTDIPFTDIPFASIPFASIPFATIPFASIPFASIPITDFSFAESAMSNILDKRIEVICVTLSGKEIKVTIDPTNTILNLKKNVYKKTDIMIDDQNFVYNGKPLKDNKQINSYNITDGSRINMTLQLKSDVYNVPKGFISLNYYIKFQRSSKMIQSLRKYCDSQGILDDLELELYISDTDEEIERLYKIIECVYIKL